MACHSTTRETLAVPRLLLKSWQGAGLGNCIRLRKVSFPHAPAVSAQFCTCRAPQVLKIAMVGKYTGLSDAYLSVIKALQHACLAVSRKLQIEWVDASQLEEGTKTADPAAHAAAWAKLRGAAGVLVPGALPPVPSVPMPVCCLIFMCAVWRLPV